MHEREASPPAETFKKKVLLATAGLASNMDPCESYDGPSGPRVL